MSEEQPARTDGIGAWLKELLEALLPALVVVLVVNIFLAQATRVDGQSMNPSLHNNERVIIEKISYRLQSPERGDIVVLRRPLALPSEDPLIKRVIGLPGETVEIRDGRVFIDGQPLDEPYLEQPTWGSMPPHLVPEDHVFVLGDNRNSSNDSRFFGMVRFDNIIGKAWIRYWPPSEFGLVKSE
ncbi:MAG: signal peptidase I [Chloroflexi bacterium RBG_13_56_8]|nr:MAG: signal peptidase I [Chloroflexi bacterium RBG_13_56_8]